MKRLRRLVVAALALFAGPAAAGDVGRAPIPAIETEMHGAAINRIDATAGTLATVSDDRTLRLWNMADGSLIATHRIPAGVGNEGKLYAVAADPAGGMLAVGGWTGVEWDGGAFIYLVDTKVGRMRGRVGPFAGTVNHLAWSPDGRFLAAAFSDGVGIKVFDIRAARQVAEDKDWRDAVTWLAFDTSGRIAAVGPGGTVRLFDSDFRALFSRSVAGRPFGVAFSPDGRQIAVGHLDKAEVALFDGADLAPRGTLAGASGLAGALSVVAFSGDGLYAAGTYGAADGTRFVRHFALSGATDVAVGRDTVVDLRAHNGGFVFATAEPSWGVVDGSGKAGAGRRKAFADFRDGAAGFRVSRDGAVVQFGFEQGGKRALRFDLAGRSLQPAGQRDEALPGPVAGEVKVTGWRNGTQPRVDGQPLRLGEAEIARSYAAVGKRQWLLGTDHALRLYDGATPLWTISLPAPAWTVAVAPKAGLAVAGLGDGTLRWYALKDGRERLALFAHADAARWIAWTPDGFFDHSPGGDSLFGYHLNHGKNALGEFVESAQLYRAFFRRDLVVKSLRGGSDQEIAAQLAQIGDVRRVLTTALPPRLAGLEICPVADSQRCHSLDTATVRRGGGGKIDLPGEAAVLKVRLEDRGGGIGPLVVRRNGAAVAGETVRSAALDTGKGRIEEVLIALQPGDNEVTVSAVSADGRVELNGQDQLTARVRSLAVPTANRPVLHVLAVGISKYVLPELELANARRDAESVARLMRSGNRDLYRDSVVVTRLDADAGLDGIISGFEELAAGVRPEDTVLVFLAGHGIAQDGQYVFLPADLPAITAQAVSERGLTQARLSELLSRVTAAKTMLMVDTCFAGAIDGDALGRKARDDTWVGSLGRSTGRFTLVSTSDEQEALDGIDDNGVFTGVLLEGLRGQADKVPPGDRNGSVNVYEIVRFTKTRMPEVVRQVAPGHLQEPVFHFAGSDFFEIRSLD